MDMFAEYGAVSGQFLSLNKCRFYVGSIGVRRLSEISVLLGFQHGHLPFAYS